MLHFLKQKQHNSAMEADTIKNAASSKSHMHRRDFFRMICLALFAAVFIFSGCDKDKNKDEVENLVTEIFIEDEGEVAGIRFEYDNQNRITKIVFYEQEAGYYASYTDKIIYNNVNLITVIDVDGDTITFTRTGNTITVKPSWWYDYGYYTRRETYEVNAQGLIVKGISEGIWDDGDWWKETVTFQYQGRNLVKVISNWEEMWYGEYDSRDDYTTILTYDDKKAPFYYSSTPQWLLFWFENLILYGTQNNVTSINWEDEDELTFEYTYNTNGFPLTRTITRYYWDEAWRYTETFKYDNNSTAGQRNALYEIPSDSDVGVKRDMKRDNFVSKNRRLFGSSIERPNREK